VGDGDRDLLASRLLEGGLLEAGDLSGGGSLAIGRYEVVGRLGEGASGEVYLARDPVVGREVALKVLAGTASPEARARFVREVQALARVEHEHLVRVYDAGVQGERPWFAMERVGSRTLADLRLGPADLAAALAGAARACAAAHAAGIVHRDLKPANLVARDRPGPPALVVVDLGVARLAAEEGLTREGTFLGTPGYAAPEQLRGDAAGPAADVYALGVILYEGLCGRRPFEPEGRDLRALAERLAGEAPPPPSWWARVPAEPERLALAALAREPGARPSAAGFAEALDAWLPAGAREAVGPPTVREGPGATPPDLEASGRLGTSRRRRGSSSGGLSAARLPDRVGPYAVLEEVGRGAYGVVLRARAPDGRDVALKLLASARADRVRRFERERRMLAALGEDEGFVPLLDAGAAASGPYVVMPFVAGGTLDGVLRRGPLPVADALRIGRALAAGMAEAHRRGIVHRDLKPSNVLLAEGGRPLVADLGLAKPAGEAPTVSQELSKTGELRGTLGYMAPEQAMDAKRVGPAADVFALGAILYRCLTGEAPFAGEGQLAVVRAAANGDVVPLRRLRPDAPRWLERVVAVALQPEPAERYADAGVLAEALAGPRGGGRSAGAALGVVAAGALVAAGVLAWGGGDDDPRPERAATPAPSSPAADRPPTEASEEEEEEEEAPGPAEPAPAEPAPEPAPPRPEEVPQCRDLREGRRYRLAAVGGEYRAKHGALVNAGALAPDGAAALSGGSDGRVFLWDTADGRQLRSFRSDVAAGCGAVAFSADGRYVLAGVGGRLLVWDRAGGGLHASLPAHGGGLETLLPLADGRVLTGGDDGVLRVWDVAAGRQVRAFEGVHGGVRAACLLPGEEAVLASEGEVLRVRGGDLARRRPPLRAAAVRARP